MSTNLPLLAKLTSLAKRRGFVYPTAEVYGGVAGFWDWGHHGVLLKNNIRNLWWRKFLLDKNDMLGLDSAIIGPESMFRASGHLANFSDPLEGGGEFNLMFTTKVGASAETAQTAYLRPETAQGIFVNFKNIIDSFHPKLPFGVAQIGKAFRNEITPREFLFRAREFEQMEIEYFVSPDKWPEIFEEWRLTMRDFFRQLGLSDSQVLELEVPKEERAHYSLRTIDFEFEFPFGRKELAGLAYRGDYDLKAHAAASGVDFSILVGESKERLLPHVIEPTFGLDRLVLAVLASSFTEDELAGEPRAYLKLPEDLAPVKMAVFPLLRNKPDLVKTASSIYERIKKVQPATTFDDNGNIGKRYRRQDEIGTPWCLTVDFQTIEDGTVTVRDRDTGKQERVAEEEIIDRLSAGPLSCYH